MVGVVRAIKTVAACTIHTDGITGDLLHAENVDEIHNAVDKVKFCVNGVNGALK